MVTTKQFLHDLGLLFSQKYRTMEAIGEVLAKGLNMTPETFYSNFIHYMNGTKNIPKHTLRGFYRIFQAELDEIKKGKAPSVDIPLQEEPHLGAEEYIEKLKRTNDDLSRSLGKIIESNRILIRNNKKLTETQNQLIARLNELTGKKK